MNPSRSHRYVTALLGAIFLFLGYNLGFVLDQAAGLSMDRALMVAFQQCYCVEAALPLAANIIRANAWTLTGALGGLLLGLAAGWAVGYLRRGGPATSGRRFSSFRQASELARFSQALSHTLELDRILEQVHAEVLHVTGADCGSSFLLDPASPEHRVARRAGEGAELTRLTPMEAEAVSAGRGRLVRDFEAEGEAPPHVGIRSALLVPITHEEHAIGLIHLHSQTPDTFDNETHDFVQVLAAQAAVAINNAQRYEEQSRRSEALRQRVNQLQQLAEIPNTVRADRPLAANLETIAQTMQQAGGFGFALIYVFAPEANHLRLAAAAGLAPEWFERLRQQPAPWERLQPFLRDEFRSERVFVTPQAQLADVYQALELSAPRKAHEPRTPGQWHPDDLLLVPLHGAGGETAGLLAVNAPRDPQAPRGPVLEMLAVFASQATLAIENAQLLREAEERVNEAQARAVQLGALTEATGLITASLRVEDVITRGLDQLRRIIPYDAVTFWQRDLNDGRWQVAGARSYQEAIERVIERAERSQPRLFSEIVATRGVISVGDVSRDVRFSAREVSTMRSWLGVPVQTGGQVTGILALEKGEDGFYGAAQTPVALAFASRLGAALENARLHEESVRHARDMETRGHRLALLNRIAGDLAAAREAGVVLRLALQALHEALETASAAGVLFESDVPLAAPAILAEQRLPAGAEGPPLALRDNALLDRLAETAAHLLAEAGAADGDNPARAEHLAWVGPGTATALFLPLAAEGRLLGVLGLGHHVGSRFLSGDVDLAWATAQQVALAVRNLRLQARTREQAVMHEVTRALSRPASRADLYAALHETLSTLAGVRYFTLALHDATRNETTFPLVVEEGAVVAAAASLEPLPPSGLVRHVIQGRQAVRLSGDVAAQAKALGAPLTLPGHHPVRGRAGQAGAPLAEAYLAVPLLLGERVTGALICEDHDRADAFDDQTERLVAAAAAQAAITIENIQVYEQAREGLAEAQTRATHLEALTEIATHLAAAQRTDEVVAAALDQARRLLPYDHANFWLREGGERRAAAWHLAGARGDGAAAAAAAPSFEAGAPLGDVLTARRALAAPDTSQDARFSGPGRSWLGVPLLSGEEVIGVLEFVAAAPGALAAAQVKPAQALAARVTAGLEQARRFEAGLNHVQALDRQAQRLAQLNQAAVSLAGQQEVEGLLATTARLALECLRTLRAGIVLFGDEANELRAARLPEPGAAEDATQAARAAAPLLRRLRGMAQAISLTELNTAHPAPAEQLLWVGGGVEAAVFAPLQAGGEALGVLAVGAPDAARAFTDEDLETLSGLAGLAAAALHKALHYEAARQRQAEQALAGLMSRALSPTTSAAALADALHAQLDAWLKPARAWLAVYDPARHILSFPLAVDRGQRVTRDDTAPDPVFNHVLTTQQPLLLAERDDADLAAQLRELGLPADALGGASSFLAAPLRLGDSPLGVLALADPGRAPRLAATHQRILSVVALQAAISLESARAHDDQAARLKDLEARAGRLAWLHRTSAELAAALEPQPILQAALNTLSELLQAEHAAAVLFAEAGSATVLARCPSPTEAAAEPAHLQLAGQPLFERLLPGLAQLAGPVLLPDLPAEADLNPEHYRWLHPASRAAAFFPLAAGGELLGVAAFARAVPGPVFTADRLEQAQAVLEQAAVAVRNASLYQAAQTRLAEQTTISQISRALSRSLELPELLRSVHEQLAAWLGPKTLHLALYEEARNQVTFPLAVMLGQTLELPHRAPEGLLRHVIQSQRPILAAAGAPERLEELGLNADALSGAETFLGAPLLAGSRLIGALTVTDPQRVPALTDSHARIFAALAGQIAVTVDNARQHELTRQATAAAQERSAQAGRLAEAMGAVAGALHAGEVVDRALAQLQRLTSAEALTYWRQGGGNPPAWEVVTTRRPAAPGAEPEPAPLPPALAEALTSGRAPIVIADLSRDQRFSGSLLRRAAAWLGVPVISQGEVVGLLTLEAAQPHGFQPSHAAVAESFARQTALALENAERHETSLRRVQEFERRGEALTRIAVDLHSTLELDALAPLAARVLASAFSADSAGLLVLAESPLGSGLSLLAHGQSPAPERPATPRLSGNLLVDLLRDAVRPVPIADVSIEGGLKPEHTTWAGSTLRAGLFLPLRHGGRLLGVAGVGSAQPRDWTEAELELAQALGAQTAAAINNAQRHADTETGLREQSTSLQIIRGLSQAASIAGLVETLRARLGDWLGADSVDLALYDEAANTATLAGPAENGQRRAGPVFPPGGLLLRVLETRRSLRLTGEPAHDSYALGQPADAALPRPPRWSDRPGEPPVGVSYLAAPVLLGEQRLGVLAVEAEDRAGAFTERHERLLTSIAAQVAVTLDQLQLRSQARLALEAAHERVAQLEALAGALSAITTAAEGDDVAGLALEQFRQVVAYDRAAFWRRDDGGAGGWQLAAARGAWAAEALADAEAHPWLDEVAAGRTLVLATGSNGARDARPGAASAYGSRLALPLINRGAVIGVVTLEAAEANAYTPRQAALAQALGQQAAAVYSQSRQMAVSLQRVVELDERARRLAFLNRFAGELNASLDLNHILRLTLKALAEANGAEMGAAAAFDEARATLLALEHYPDPAASSGPMGQLLLPGSSLLDRLQDAAEPVTVDAAALAEVASRLRPADLRAEGAPAGAHLVPLMSAGQLVGLVGLGQSEAGRLTASEAELTRAIAERAAAALLAARQLEQTQQRLAEQAAINQITRAFSRAGDLHALTDGLWRQMQAWIGADWLYVAVYADDRNEVTFPLAVEAGRAVRLAPRAPAGLVRHLIHQRQGVRLNGEVPQQLKALGLYVTGLGQSIGLEDAAPFTACLGVPLLMGEQAIGALIAANPRRTEQFDESHERIVAAVAGHLAAALSLARQHEQALAVSLEAQARAAQLTDLAEAAGVIASARRTDQLISLTLEQLRRLLPYDGAAFWRREGALNGADPDSGGSARWRLAAARGSSRAGPEPGVLMEFALARQDPLAEVLSLRGPVVIEDTSRDARFGRAGAWLGIPLAHDNEVLGLVALEKREPGGFTAAHLPLARAFGKQAAVALANVRLFEASTQRARELDERTALLNRVAASFSTSVEPQTVLQTALAALAELLDVDRAAALLLDDARALPRARAQAHYPPGALGVPASLPLTPNLLLDHLREGGAPVAAPDVGADAVVLPEHAAWIGPEVKSALFLPLAVAGRLIGLIGLGATRARRQFTPADSDLALTLANQAAIAVHNARLYQRTQRRMVEMAAISQSSRAISQTIDLQELFETVRAQVEVNLRADSMYVALYDEARHEVSFPLAVERGQAVELSPRPPDALVSHILTTRQSLLLTGDLQRKAAEAGLRLEAEAGGDAAAARVKAYLGVPLLIGAKARGVLAVEDYQRAYAFTEKHERGLLSIAAPIAAAVDGARLYAESARRALALDARAALLGRMAAELSEAAEPAVVLRFTVQVLAETLQADVAGALALDDNPEASALAALARYPDDDGALPAPAVDSPLLARLAESLSPLSLDDVAAAPEARADAAAWLGPEVQSALFLPLIAADRLVGLAAVGHTQAERTFTPGEVELAVTLVSQASVALANARAQQKLQPRLAELATISRICQALGRPASLAQLTDLLRAEVGGTLQAEVLILARYDEARAEVSYPLVFESGQTRAAPAGPAAGLLRRLLGQREALLLNGAEARAAAEGLPLPGFAPNSLIGVPLWLGGRAVGALVAADQDQAGRFTPSQAFILSTVATPIAVAVENARLRDERDGLRRATEFGQAQVALAGELSRALLGVLDPASVLRLSLEALGRALDLTTGAAALAPEAEGGPWRVVRPATEDSAPAEIPPGLLARLAQPGEAALAYSAPEPLKQELGWAGDDLQAALVLPLRAGADLIGLLALGDNDTPRAFDAEAVALAALGAGQAAVALETARHYARERQQHGAAAAWAEQLRAAAEVAQACGAARGVEAVAAAALDHLPRVLPYDSAAVWVVEAGARGWMRAAAARGGSAPPASEAVDPRQDAVLAEALEAGGVRTTESFVKAAPEAKGRPTGWSRLTAVLGPSASPVGVLVVEKAAAGFYQAEHARIAPEIAAPLAAALEHARQHEAAAAQANDLAARGEQLRRAAEARLAEQAALNRLGAALDAAQSWTAAAEALVEPAQAALGVDTLYLALCSEAEDEVSFPLLLEAGQRREAAPRPAAGVIAHILQTRRPLLLAGDLAGGLLSLGLPHRGAQAERTAGDPSAARAFAGAPLLHGGRVLGVLAAEDLERADGLGEAQANWLQAAAHLLAATAARLEAAADAERTAAQLAEARAQHAQASQAAQGFEQEAQAQAAALAELEARHARALAAARELEQALAERERARQAWQDRASAALAEQTPPAPDDLNGALDKELRQASQALEADAGMLFLWEADADRLVARASVGKAPVEQTESLARAVIVARAAEAFPDLTRSERPPNDTAEAAPESETPAPAEAAPEAGPGPFVSGLALPIFALDGEAPAGALVFLSRRPAAFAVDSPAAALAAEQAGLRLRAAALAEALRLQTQRFRGLLDDPALQAAPTPAVDLEAPPPISPRPIAVPAFETPVPLPAETPAPLERTEAERPARPAWRRAAVPAAIGLMVVCGLAAVTVGPLRGMAAGLLGGAATATPTATAAAPEFSPTAPAIQPTAQPSATPSLEPTDTLAPATPTPTASITPTSAPTETSTPDVSPTPPLPPDVTAVAVVNLPAGIAGRLRDAPNGNVVGGVPGDTLVHVLAGRETTPDNIVWVRIRLVATGQTGWFAEDLLIYQTPGG